MRTLFICIVLFFSGILVWAWIASEHAAPVYIVAPGN